MYHVSKAAVMYTEELYKLGHGLPQWQPEVPTKTGDIGFFIGGTGGRFYRLFNIHDTAEDQPDGVPWGFEPFIVQSHLRIASDCQLDAQPLHSLSVQRTDLAAGISSFVTLQYDLTFHTDQRTET